MGLKGLSLVILKCDRCKHAKLQWWLKSPGLYWRCISTKRDSSWGHPGEQFALLSWCLEVREPLPRLSPTMSPGGTGQCPLGSPGALGESMCQKLTLTSWRTMWADNVCCMTRSSTTTTVCTWSPVTPGVGMDRVSSSPAQMGITRGGGARHRHAALTANEEKKTQTNQPAKIKLCLEWGQQLIPSAQCWGGHVWIPCLVLGPLVWGGVGGGNWSQGVCGGLGMGIGQVWQAKSRQRGSSCCCLKGSKGGDEAELAGCCRHQEGSGVGWAAAPPRRPWGCHGSLGLMPWQPWGAASHCTGTARPWLATVCFCYPRGVRGDRLPCL